MEYGEIQKCRKDWLSWFKNTYIQYVNYSKNKWPNNTNGIINFDEENSAEPEEIKINWSINKIMRKEKIDPNNKSK